MKLKTALLIFILREETSMLSPVNTYPRYIPITRQTPSLCSANPNNSPEYLNNLVQQLGTKVEMPNAQRNYIIFNNELVSKIVPYREHAIFYVDNFLKTAQTEQQICEGLYVLDRMLDMRTNGIALTYPTISRFNNTDSPNVQVMLAGIYRKTQVPDAFGPLINMMIRNAQKPQATQPFDPAEEIGGAILDYIRNASTANAYKNFTFPV